MYSGRNFKYKFGCMRIMLTGLNVYQDIFEIKQKYIIKRIKLHWVLIYNFVIIQNFHI